MTGRELIREYFPEASDDDCELILWEYTSYPFSSIDEIREELRIRKEALAAGKESKKLGEFDRKSNGVLDESIN